MGVPLWLLGGLKPVWWLRDATLGCVCWVRPYGC